MANENFTASGKFSMPTKWAVSVIAALATAFGGTGTAMYKMGKLEAQVELLTRLCGKQLTQTAENQDGEAQRSPLKHE